MSSAYNSSAGLNQYDSDITIIRDSMFDEHNDEYVNNTYVPIITRLKQANNSSENRQTTNPPIISNNNNNNNNDNNRNDYIFVDHNPQDHAKELEQILSNYIKDLKQETNTQFDCSRQIVIHLMGIIRSAYPNDQQKMIELDKVMEEIATLHDKRHLEQREKLEQLRTEIHQLNEMLQPTGHDQLIENNQTYSISNNISHGEPSIMYDYNQWTEIEDDTKKLHEIIQSQKNQINEIVTLVSQAAASTCHNPTTVSINDSKISLTNNQDTQVSDTHLVSSLVQKIKDIAEQKPQQQQQQQQQSTPIVLPEHTTLQNHSPGASPDASLSTLVLESLKQTVDKKTQRNEEEDTIQIDNQEVHDKQIENEVPIHEEPHVPVVIPVIQKPAPQNEREQVPAPRISPQNEREQVPVIRISPQNESKKCPVCGEEFPPATDDIAMYDHIEKCLFPSGTATAPKDYACPNCNRKFPGNDEKIYHQHLSDCYNREI